MLSPTAKEAPTMATRSPNDSTNPGLDPKRVTLSTRSPIEQLLEIMDSALAQQAEASAERDRTFQKSLEHINDQITVLRSRFDSVDGKVGFDERLRDIERQMDNVATRSDVHELNTRLAKIESAEKQRVEDRENTFKDVKSTVLKSSVQVVLLLVVIGFFVLVWLQMQAMNTNVSEALQAIQP